MVLTGRHGAESAQDVQITPEMAEAGLKVLRESGLVDDPVEADILVVEKIYRAMALASVPASAKR